MRCLTDQNFVSLLHSVQLCKELTEKRDHGSEIRGKFDLSSFKQYSLSVCIFKFLCCIHRNKSWEFWQFEPISHVRKLNIKNNIYQR